MKKILAILLSAIMLLSVTALFSCKGQTDDVQQSEPENTDDLPVHSYTPPAYDAEGNYLGFSDITEGYTPEDAVAASSEPWLQERVYRKLNEKARRFFAGHL